MIARKWRPCAIINRYLSMRSHQPLKSGLSGLYPFGPSVTGAVTHGALTSPELSILEESGSELNPEWADSFAIWSDPDSWLDPEWTDSTWPDADCSGLGCDPSTADVALSDPVVSRLDPDTLYPFICACSLASTGSGCDPDGSVGDPGGSVNTSGCDPDGSVGDPGGSVNTAWYVADGWLGCAAAVSWLLSWFSDASDVSLFNKK